MNLNIKSSLKVHHMNLLGKGFTPLKLSIKDPQTLYYPIQVNYQILRSEITQQSFIAKQIHLQDYQELHDKIKVNAL